MQLRKQNPLTEPLSHFLALSTIVLSPVHVIDVISPGTLVLQDRSYVHIPFHVEAHKEYPKLGLDRGVLRIDVVPCAQTPSAEFLIIFRWTCCVLQVAVRCL